MTPMLHHIQKSILDVLATAESRRYGEIKPVNLDGNVFGYHLKQLVIDHYVVKRENGEYALTAIGRDYIVHRSEDSTSSAHTIFLIVLEQDGRFLLRTRKVQPMLGMSGFVHGEPQPGELVTDTARRRLLNKTGIDVHLEVRGTALITQYKGDELQSFSHAIILYASTDQGMTRLEDETGINYWVDAAEVEHDNTLPSCRDIISQIDEKNFWLERTYHL